MTRADIDRLSSDELIDVIHASGLVRHRPKLAYLLEFYDREKLWLLAHLAQHRCQRETLSPDAF